jgi:hypothetical protein
MAATLTTRAKNAAKKPARKKAAAKPAPKAEVSDSAVLKATGKPLEHWFKVLDRAAKARGEHSHKAAAEHLHAQHAMHEWWCQMVTVLYERARGLRDKHQRPDGYSVSVSRTIAVPVSSLYAAWSGTKKWLEAEPFTIRKATKDKSLRITWSDATSVEVMLYAKGAGKSQVTVQHSKLKSAAAGEKMKKFWGAALDGLRAELEGAS